MTNEEAQRESAESFAHLCLSYSAVFGTEGNRTMHQQLVWDDLTKRCYVNVSTVIPSAQGACDPFRFAVAEGRRQVLLEINQFLSRYKQMSNKEQPKQPKVKK